MAPPLFKISGSALVLGHAVRSSDPEMFFKKGVLKNV